MADIVCTNDAEGRSDIANGRRFATRFADRARYCRAWRSWIVWDDRRWRRDDTGAAERMAASISDDLWTEARSTNNPEALKFAAKTASDVGIRAMLKRAESERSLVISPSALDRDPWLFNVENGTVDLRTGQLREHRREDLLTKLCPTPYDPDAKANRWDGFLCRVFRYRQDVIDFVQRWFGYCLTGDISEQVLAIFHGWGANGKSTLTNTMMDVLGPDYAMQQAPEFLMAKRNESTTPDRMELCGKRFVSCTETQDGQRLDEAFVKLLTGGESIRGRRLYENSWEFPPTHKIVLSTNYRPRVKGTNHAIWRRIRLVPFDEKFWNPEEGETGPPELRQDKHVREALREEAQGILAWAVRGCLDWQHGGLGTAEAITVATKAYRTEQDVVGGFIASCCVQADDAAVRFGDLYAALKQHCDDTGDNLPSRKFVATYLTQHGFECDQSRVRCYRGIGLLA